MKRLLLSVVMLTTAISTYAAPADRAKLWASWSDQSKHMFVEGFARGLTTAAIRTALVVSPDATRLEANREYVALLDSFDLESVQTQLIPLVNRLYEDPANAYITIEDMILIARSKLAGDAVDSQLARARETAIALDRILNNKP